MKVFAVIIAILWIWFYILLPITTAIKESINKNEKGNTWDIKAFLKNMFYVIFPFLCIAIFFVLFYLFAMLFKNLILTSITTLCVSLILLKIIDK